jgi:hypothetical protein
MPRERRNTVAAGAALQSLGFALNENKAAAFKLEVEWVKVKTAEPAK